MADASKYWLGPGTLRVEKKLIVREGEELTKQLLNKIGKGDAKKTAEWIDQMSAIGKVGEKIMAVGAGRPTKEVSDLKALVAAKDEVIAELEAKIEELEAMIEVGSGGKAKGGDKK